jgi:hypothetical protein
MLYGPEGTPGATLGPITSISRVTEEYWNVILDVAASVQVILNTSEQVQPGIQLGAALTKWGISPKQAVAAVLLGCHLGYSTVIPETDSDADIFCQKHVWQTLQKQCAHLMKSDTREELSKWLHGHVNRHERGTHLAETRPPANT